MTTFGGTFSYKVLNMPCVTLVSCENSKSLLSTIPSPGRGVWEDFLALWGKLTKMR
jgi:hypothetical protein